jgi:hypothetical protein
MFDGLEPGGFATDRKIAALTLATVFVQKTRKGFFHARVIARATKRLRALNDIALEASRQLAPPFEQSGTETGEDAQL